MLTELRLPLKSPGFTLTAVDLPPIGAEGVMPFTFNRVTPWSTLSRCLDRVRAMQEKVKEPLLG